MTEDGTCPTTEIQSRTIDELRKLQRDTVKAIKDHPTGGKTFDEKISRILNTLAKSAGNPPKSPRKASDSKPNCFLWLRGKCSRDPCQFKHDPALKGSAPEAGRQKKSTSATSTPEPSDDAPKTDTVPGCATPGCTALCALRDASSGTYHRHCSQKCRRVHLGLEGEGAYPATDIVITYP